MRQIHNFRYLANLMFALIFLPDERNSQVGLGSSLKGASSSTYDDGHDDGDDADDGDYHSFISGICIQKNKMF